MRHSWISGRQGRLLRDTAAGQLSPCLLVKRGTFRGPPDGRSPDGGHPDGGLRGVHIVSHFKVLFRLRRDGSIFW